MPDRVAALLPLCLLLVAACTSVRVTDATPEGSAVPVDTTVSATFSRPLDPASLTAESLRLERSDGRPVAGSVQYRAPQRQLVFTPGNPLSYGTPYRARLLPDITDAEGRPLRGGYEWRFATHKAQVEVTWAANREWEVNGPGGGYRIFYGSTPNFDLGRATVIDIPYQEGDTAPTAATIPLAAGTYYFRVKAYSRAFPEGSEPSAEVSFTVP